MMKLKKYSIKYNFVYSSWLSRASVASDISSIVEDFEGHVSVVVSTLPSSGEMLKGTSDAHFPQVL